MEEGIILVGDLVHKLPQFLIELSFDNRLIHLNEIVIPLKRRYLEGSIKNVPICKSHLKLKEKKSTSVQLKE